MKSRRTHGVNADKKRGISSKKRKNRRKKKERKKNKKKVVAGHWFGKIVVHALARSLLAARARARAHARSHGNSEISRSAFLLPSRSVFLLRLFHIPSRSHLIHPPTRCNDGEREEREREGERERERQCAHRADGTHRRNVLLGRERKRKSEERRR